MLAFSAEDQSVEWRKAVHLISAYFHIKSQVALNFPHSFFSASEEVVSGNFMTQNMLLEKVQL